jgi:hypothetical protein
MTHAHAWLSALELTPSELDSILTAVSFRSLLLLALTVAPIKGRGGLVPSQAEIAPTHRPFRIESPHLSPLARLQLGASAYGAAVRSRPPTSTPHDTLRRTFDRPFG